MIIPLPWQSEPIQVLADAIRNNRSALDASDTGVGKTFHALFAVKELGLPVAVVCPKSVIPAWEQACWEVGVYWRFIQNIEKLKADQTFIRGDKRKWTWHVPRCVVIYDECHRASAWNSENAAILAAAPKPVLMLSATAASDPTKLRAIGHQLGLTTWQNWYSWCGRNGCKKGHFGGIQFKGTQEHLDRLHRQIFTTGLGVRVRIADLGDQFPDCTIETVSVPVEDQAAIDQAYEKELKALESEAPNAAVEILRARQISEHAKLDAIRDMAMDLVAGGHSVAIFVNFRDSLERLVAEFGCPAVYDQDPEERQAAITSFQADKAHVIVCMIQAGGESINLHDLHGNRPRTSLIFPGWSARELVQAKGRTHRAKGKTPVFIKFVFAEGTIEQKIRKKVNQKLKNIETLNDGDLTMYETNKQSSTEAESAGSSEILSSAQFHESVQEVPGSSRNSHAGVDRPGNPATSEQGKNDNVIHGQTCRKVAHVDSGYLHAADDDTPYDVDGWLYCGRCHRVLDPKDNVNETKTDSLPVGGLRMEVPDQKRQRESRSGLRRSAVALPRQNTSQSDAKSAAATSAERTHATISPSKLKNLELSPMWIPDDTIAEHWKTARGSRCHAALETGEDGDLEPEELEWVQKCREWMINYEDWKCHREVKLDMGGGIYGYADVVFTTGNVAALVDFKFSETLQEDAETNPAAQAYVLGIFNRWPEIESVQVNYLYPILDQISQASYSRDKDYHQILLRLAVIKARVERAAKCHPYPETCTWCGRKHNCPEVQAFALPIATRYAQTHKLEIPTEYDPGQITDPATMGKAKTVASVLSKWCESVDYHALKMRQETGAEIPGFDLRQRQGKAKIINPVMAYQISQSHGIAPEQFLFACDVSAKQLKDAVAETAPRGQKQKAAQKLEDSLRDAGVLEVGAEVYYLQKTK